KSELIDTLPLQGEIFEGHCPQRLEALVGRNGIPEGPIERPIVGVEIDDSGGPEPPAFVRPHGGGIVPHSCPQPPAQTVAVTLGIRRRILTMTFARSSSRARGALTALATVTLLIQPRAQTSDVPSNAEVQSLLKERLLPGTDTGFVVGILESGTR